MLVCCPWTVADASQAGSCGDCLGTDTLAFIEGEIDMLPWNEMEALQLETEHIKAELVSLNKAGYLTINSQPAVNGAPSTDSKFGWGGPNG